MPLKFRMQLIADERYESADAFDVNNDGVLDIVSGAYWYEGPDFAKKHPVGEVKAFGEYYDDFSTIPLDINGDGRLDFVTGGWWGNTLRWRENPGDPGKPWPEHVIAETGNIETTRAWDVDGDGQLEIVPNTPGGPLVVYKLVTDAAGKGTGAVPGAQDLSTASRATAWASATSPARAAAISSCSNGWLEAPEDPFRGAMDLPSRLRPRLAPASRSWWWT